MVERKEVYIRGRANVSYDIKGVADLDYMDLFKKFAYTYGNQESYSLNHISHVVLGEKKIDYSEFGNLKNFHNENYQKFIDYNIKDVELIERLEEKLGLITLVMTVAYMGGVNYTDTLGTVAIWDAIIYRNFRRKKQVPYLKQMALSDYKIFGAKPKLNDKRCSNWFTDTKESNIAGGYVKEVQEGMHNWVMSFDLNSLYPNIIVQNNISPETLRANEQKFGVKPDTMVDGTAQRPQEHLTMCGNGATFVKWKARYHTRDY